MSEEADATMDALRGFSRGDVVLARDYGMAKTFVRARLVTGDIAGFCAVELLGEEPFRVTRAVADLQHIHE